MTATAESRALARSRLAALRRRTLLVRRRVIAGALASFTVVWVGLVVQMAAGNDPALHSGSSGGRDHEQDRTRPVVIETEEGPAVVQGPAAPQPASTPAPVTTSQS